MSVKFLKHIREDILGVTRYRLARMLNVPTPSIDHAEEKGHALKMEILCRLRLISGLKWSDFGKLLDSEFLDGEKK